MYDITMSFIETLPYDQVEQYAQNVIDQFKVINDNHSLYQDVEYRDKISNANETVTLRASVRQLEILKALTDKYPAFKNLRDYPFEK
jgi:hypothetical protein